MCHRCIARRGGIRQPRARRSSCHGMRIVERDLVDRRKHLEREARRRIGRERLARARHAAPRVARPAAFVARRPGIERVVDAELPDAVLFDELVLVERCAHRSTRAEIQLLHHPRAHLGRLAVGRDMDDGLVLHVVAEPVLGRTFLAEHVEQERAHALAADVDTALRELDRAVRGEQVREIVPEVLVEVVAVRARQVVDLVEVLGARDLLLGLCEQGLGRRLRLTPARRPRHRHGRAHRGDRRIARPAASFGIARRRTARGIVVMKRRDVRLRIDRIDARRRPVRRQLGARRRHGLRVAGPALVVVGNERREVAKIFDLPNAVVLDEGVLVDAFAPFAVALEDARHVELAAREPWRCGRRARRARPTVAARDR